MPPACQAAALPTKVHERWASELQSFSPRGCVLKTVPHLAISRGPSQIAGGRGAPLAHAPLLCTAGTSSTSRHRCCLLASSWWLPAQHAGSLHHPAEVPRGCCSALGCGPPSIYFFLAAKQACKSPALPHTLFPPSRLQLATPSLVPTQLLTKPPRSARLLKCPGMNWGTRRERSWRKWAEWNMWERPQPASLMSKMTVELYPSGLRRQKKGFSRSLLCVSALQVRGLEQTGHSTHPSVSSPFILSLTFLSCLQT